MPAERFFDKIEKDQIPYLTAMVNQMGWRLFTYYLNDVAKAHRSKLLGSRLTLEEAAEHRGALRELDNVLKDLYDVCEITRPPHVDSLLR